MDQRLTLFSCALECVNVLIYYKTNTVLCYAKIKIKKKKSTTSEPQGFASNYMALCPVYFDYFVLDLKCNIYLLRLRFYLIFATSEFFVDKKKKLRITLNIIITNLLQNYHIVPIFCSYRYSHTIRSFTNTFYIIR